MNTLIIKMGIRVKFYIIFRSLMKLIKDYESALDYIYSFIDYSLTKDLRYSPEKFNLDRMARFMDLLGNPQNKYKVIHVAGTKGKGSICAMITSILTQAGYRVGFYSSPHMIEFTERIRIGDQEIEKEMIVSYCNHLSSYIEQIENLSTFEIITGMAFQYFADQKVDFAVIEVGMGGRLDATNVVNPVITAISSISIDHTQVLGKSIKKIAAEKAGIIKNGIPVVLATQKARAEEIVRSESNKKKAKLVNVRECCSYIIQNSHLHGQEISISFHLPNSKINQPADSLELFIPLVGDHQVDNVITAVMVIRELAGMGWQITDTDIKNGMRNLMWQGRFEIISENPLMFIDGAHNVDSFIKLRDTIRKYLAGRQITLLFGVSEDKQVKRMLKEIRTSVHHLVITQSTHPRAMDPFIVEEIAKQLGYDCTVEPDITKAVERLMKNRGKSDAIIASGSLFVAGAVKEIMTKKVPKNG
jgi:dihydrofolate synthase/folylpolyglutamate synthase